MMMTMRMSISAPPQAPPISALRGKDGAEETRETRETREQITQTHTHIPYQVSEGTIKN